MEASLSFEQGPIRPPSEAGSLLIRATRNCPWNKCAFCSTYRGRKFSRRSLDEIKADVDAAAAVKERIESLSRDLGDGGKLTRPVLSQVMSDPTMPDSFRSVALWMASGGDTVFLQDANSIMLSTNVLVELLEHIRKTFPKVTRITSYARASTLKAKSVEDFGRLKNAGLTRLHVGMESGSDTVLKLISKGARAEQVIEGGKRAKQGGISICLYVIPGIGGVEHSKEHALESARVINAINPDFVRFRSLYVKRGSDLHTLVEEGKFHPPDEDDLVKEIKLLVENLEGINSTLVSDHVLNLLEEVQGTLPQDKEAILAVIDRYLSLPEHDRLLFQLGRRGAGLRSLAELEKPGVRAQLEAAKQEIEKDMPEGIPGYISAMKRRFL